PRRVHLASRDHRRNATVQVTIDPAELILARSPIPGDRMYMTVHQPGRERGALGVADSGSARRVDVFFFANGGNLAIHSEHAVGIENRVFQVPAEEQTNIPDNETTWCFLLCRFLGHDFPSIDATSPTLFLTKGRQYIGMTRPASPC